MIDHCWSIRSIKSQWTVNNANHNFPNCSLDFIASFVQSILAVFSRKWATWSPKMDFNLIDWLVELYFTDFIAQQVEINLFFSANDNYFAN